MVLVSAITSALGVDALWTSGRFDVWWVVVSSVTFAEHPTPHCRVEARLKASLKGRREDSVTLRYASSAYSDLFPTPTQQTNETACRDIVKGEYLVIADCPTSPSCPVAELDKYDLFQVGADGRVKVPLFILPGPPGPPASAPGFGRLFPNEALKFYNAIGAREAPKTGVGSAGRLAGNVLSLTNEDLASLWFAPLGDICTIARALPLAGKTESELGALVDLFLWREFSTRSQSTDPNGFAVPYVNPSCKEWSYWLWRSTECREELPPEKVYIGRFREEALARCSKANSPR
jgi:hypothetical protein